MLSGIRWRVTIPVLLLVAGCVGFSGLYLVNSVRDNQIDMLRNRLEDEARVAALAALPFLSETGKNAGLDSLAKSIGEETGIRITIAGPDGLVLGDSEEDYLEMSGFSSQPEIAGAMESGLGENTRYSTVMGSRIMYLAVPVLSRGEMVGVVRIASPLTGVEAAASEVTRLVMITLGASLGVAALVAMLVARSIRRSLNQVTNGVKRIAGGELGYRIPVSPAGEMGQMGIAFNEMSSWLKDVLDRIAADRDKMAMIIASMADGVIMTDDRGDVILANPAAENLFIFREEQARGRHFIEVVHDYEIDRLLKQCLRTGKEQSSQLESGVSKRFLRIVAIPLKMEGPTGALVVFHDFTELRSLQTMRRELVGNISHELRTPLANIRAVVETLKDGAIDDKEVTRNFLTIVNSQVERMTQILVELAELSRIESGRAQLRLEETNLNLIVRQVVGELNPFAEGQKVTVRIDDTPELPMVRADGGQIRQVVTNLLHNAIKFTSEGGGVLISNAARSKSVVVSISDTGAGISPDDVPHVFERFYKVDKARSGGGTGMGLAIAKHIVKAHGGSIWVESDEGKGSVFSFRLPLVAGKSGNTGDSVGSHEAERGDIE
ncbi:MAG: ATP-binding protein [Dehalococcoidales bacterium]